MAQRRHIRNILAAVVALLAQSVTAVDWNQWSLAKTYDSTNFFEEFAFWVSTEERVDPTHGYVNYRNASDAQRLGLADIKGGAVYLGVDSKTANMDPNATFGRSSVRVYSMQQYKFGLFIYDIAHFPAKACGVWPAMWMYGANWPKNGEIDIYEGWNDNFEMTRQTLHTSPGCRVLGAGQTNKMEWIDCNVANKSQPFNFGCSSDRLDGSWGSSNGGIFAVQWTPKGIQMWNWAHDAAPRDIETRAPAPNTWGTPNFNTQGAGNECDIERLFGEQWLVFNTVFCGDAAAADTYWHQTSCYKKGHMTCADYVAKHPAAFTDVYWLINSVNIYLPAGLTPPSIKPRGAALPEHAEEIRTAPSWE